MMPPFCHATLYCSFFIFTPYYCRFFSSFAEVFATLAILLPASCDASDSCRAFRIRFYYASHILILIFMLPFSVFRHRFSCRRRYAAFRRHFRHFR
jgi:hypothetical protein